LTPAALLLEVIAQRQELDYGSAAAFWSKIANLDGEDFMQENGPVADGSPPQGGER